jgi:hypothetical protein
MKSFHTFERTMHGALSYQLHQYQEFEHISAQMLLEDMAELSLQENMA